MIISGKSKKILFILGILLGLCITSMVFISLLFGEKITDFVIKKINENLNTEISVSKADFSIFRRFPNAAVIFSEVVIKPNKDFTPDEAKHLNLNLIECKKIYVEINIFKLLFNNYSIRRIVAEDGELNLVINKTGIQNFDVFKKSENKSGSKTSVNLAGILLKNFRYSYLDVKHDIELNGLAQKLNLKGSIRDDQYAFNISFDILSRSVLIKRVEYLKNRKANSQLELNKQGDIYRIETPNLDIEGIEMDFKMIFSSNDKSEIDLLAKAADISLAGFQRLIPDDYQKYISNFESKGKTNFILSIKGKTYGEFLPHIDLSFQIKNGTILQNRNKIKLTSIGCSGKYSNGNNNNATSSSLLVYNFTSSLGQGKISGDFSYKNFDAPTVGIKLNSLIDLGSIRKFLAIDTIENLEGMLRTDIDLLAGFNNSDVFNRKNIRSLSINGNAKIVDAQLKLKGSNYLYREINSEIFLGNDIQFESLSLKIDENDFFIRGRLIDAVPYLLNQHKTINLRAELRSQNLDLSRYFEKSPGKNNDTKYDSRLLFPDNMQAELNVSISHFTLMKFHASDVVARVNYKPGMFILNSAVFSAMQGRVSGNGAVILDVNNNLIVKGQTSLKKINIKQLFYSFGNFGQNILLDRHLNGSLTGEILVSSEWDRNMNLNKNAVEVESTLEIENGELINFEPLLGLSNFIALSELKDIKFSNLRNQVFIRNQQVILPNMDIKSSAFNISGSGIHNFDNHYTYRINVLLSEVLARKAKQNKKENDEFGIVEDDGLGKTKIPLMIVGFNGDYKITYDTRGVKEIVKESMKSQKKELRSIFKEEFGMYKNDTTPIKPKSNTRFKVEWEEKQSTRQSEEQEKPSKKKKKTFEEEEGFQIDEFDK